MISFAYDQFFFISVDKMNKVNIKVNKENTKKVYTENSTRFLAFSIVFLRSCANIDKFFFYIFVCLPVKCFDWLSFIRRRQLAEINYSLIILKFHLRIFEIFNSIIGVFLINNLDEIKYLNKI